MEVALCWCCAEPHTSAARYARHSAPDNSDKQKGHRVAAMPLFVPCKLKFAIHGKSRSPVASCRFRASSNTAIFSFDALI